MRKLICLILPLILFTFISCSDDPDRPASAVLDKAGMAYSERDLVQDPSLAVSPDHNAVVFLEDPDNDALPADGAVSDSGESAESYARLQAAAADDLGESPGSDILPLVLDHDARYTVCTTLQDDISDDITVTLRDAAGTVDLTLQNEGCYDINLSQGQYTVEITKESNVLPGMETPFFVTVDRDAIHVYHNRCLYCDLEGVDLSGKKLVNTDLTGSWLNGANFDDTVLEFVNFSDADLGGATFENAHSLNLTAPPANDALSVETRGKTMYVNNLPVKAPVVKYVADHTYPVALGQQTGNRYAWGSLGCDTGGTELEDTRTDCPSSTGCIDLETVSYIMTQEPCAWPGSFPKYYATVGVCWNLTNRGLYYTGKTVHKIFGYFFVEGYFGTYGLDNGSTCFTSTCREGRSKYSWSKCKAAVEAKHPWLAGQSNDLLAQAALSQDAWQVNPAISKSDVDPRIAIYEEFFGEAAADRSAQSENGADQRSARSDENRELAYLQRLVELNISENIGEISQEQLQQILDAHSQMYFAMKSIEAASEEEYVALFNKQANETLDRYKQILGLEKYLKLMNQTEETPFDLNDYIMQ